tara:strand:+ start:80 stop:415 length:336 start_codon:yes stop_codon:yes gene_type:complete
MNPGKLDTRIEIKHVTRTSDGYGGWTNTLTTYETIWANLKEKGGDRSSEFGVRSTKTRVELYVRTNTINDATPNNISFVFKVEGFYGDYRVDDIFQSEYKYFTKIIGIKIE